jgi:hypothetical protein
MTSSEKFESFRDYLLKPIDKIIKGHYPPRNFEEFLQITFEELVAEARGNSVFYKKINEDSSDYFDGLRIKTTRLKERLFDLKPEGIYYKDAQVFVDNRESIEAQYASLMYEELINVIELFDDYSKKNLSIVKDISSNGTLDQRTNKQVYTYGFKIKNENVLYRIWELLKKNSFIDQNLSETTFERAFRGKLIKTKITWMKSPYDLHYLIDRIHGIGIEKEESGQWIKASGIFKLKKNRPLDHKVLSHASRMPSSKTRDNLNPIIDLFNKPIKTS